MVPWYTTCIPDATLKNEKPAVKCCLNHVRCCNICQGFVCSLQVASARTPSTVSSLLSPIPRALLLMSLVRFVFQDRCTAPIQVTTVSALLCRYLEFADRLNKFLARLR